MNTDKRKTDEELAISAPSNVADFKILIDRYQKPLARYIFRISGRNRHDTEDILQEVFIKIYKNLYSYNPKLKFSSWIYRIAHNCVISGWRKIKARPQIAFNIDNDIIKNITDTFDLEKNTDRIIDKQQVKQALDKLNYKYKEVLELRYMEQKTYEEISDILKKPPGTIAALINRAKKKLKKHIKYE